MKITHLIDRIVTIVTESSKRHSNPPGFLDDRPPPENQRIRELLGGLSAATIFMLTLIMYLGRGDFGTEDLLDRYVEVGDTFKKPTWAVEQMLWKMPQLPRYMARGLQQLSDAGIDADQFLGTSGEDKNDAD